MVLASNYDKSKYLRGEDLEQEKKFRIKNDTEEVFESNGKKEKKLVIWFTNDDRGLVLNKTNNRTIRGAFGDDTANWPGKIIAVFPTMVPVGGKMTPALRVRIPLPKPKEPMASPQQPVKSGNGGAAASAGVAAPLAAAPVSVVSQPTAVATGAAADPELEPDVVQPLRDELDDEVTF
jgi:hypothetical protein